MIRARFYRGRHRAERGGLTVAAIAERIRREAREAALGRVNFRIVPVVGPHMAELGEYLSAQARYLGSRS